MKLYLIAILMAFIGLWISSEVRADGLCGERSSGVFDIESWQAENAADDEIDYVVTLKSKDGKSIRTVGGTLEFFLNDKSIASSAITLDQPVAAHAQATLYFGGPRTKNSAKLLTAGKAGIIALACVDHINYADGSGTIIN